MKIESLLLILIVYTGTKNKIKSIEGSHRSARNLKSNTFKINILDHYYHFSTWLENFTNLVGIIVGTVNFM